MWLRFWKFFVGWVVCHHFVICEGSDPGVTLTEKKLYTDLMYQCPDPDFQYGCSSTMSPTKELLCIHESWACDGDPDCPQGEDELDCDKMMDCEEGEFHCADDYSFCIPTAWMCDGELDCDDGSDENVRNCPHVQRLIPCPPNQYRCPSSHKCIPMTKLCDNNIDCDEEVDEAACAHNNCDATVCYQDQCVETLDGAQCYCDEGFMPNKTLCIDLNECLYDTFCDQPAHCTNSNGSFTCACGEGYELVDRTKCKASNPSEAKLIVASGWGDIHQYAMDATSERPEFVYQSGGDRVTLLDFYNQGKNICWISHQDQSGQAKLKFVSYNSHEDSSELTMKVYLATVADFAEDWITGNWYFADPSMRRISVCDRSGEFCAVVAGGTKPKAPSPSSSWDGRLQGPQSIALDPNKGCMFVADWQGMSDASIIMALLDGTNIQKIVTDALAHPRGLTIDLANEHLYWTDNDLHTIERVNYDGENRKVIAKGVRARNIFGMSVFENYLYVTDRHENSIVKIHRYSHEVSEMLYSNVSHPGQIHVLHKVKQPIVSPDNPCNMAGCDQICAVGKENNQLVAQCLCGAGYNLNSEGICEENPGCSVKVDTGSHLPQLAEECTLEVCPANFTYCPDKGPCIPTNWWCDGRANCPDGADETELCIKTEECEITQIRCASGRCIDNDHRCDGKMDCGDDDDTDERNCEYSCDAQNLFSCGGTESTCLLEDFVCDGHADCENGQDEKNCSYPIPACHPDTEFACRDGDCINLSWKCDGDDDCPDKSDETECGPGPVACHGDELLCKKDNHCIMAAWFCDGEQDCSSGEDEDPALCPAIHNCSWPMWRCPGSIATCLQPSQVCDSHDDCPGGGDENGACSENPCNSSKCSDMCQNTPDGPMCLCPGKEKLQADGLTCGNKTAVDICARWGICGQTCTKDPASPNGYQCGCFDGYYLETDKFTCTPYESDPVYVVFSNRHEIRRAIVKTNKTVSLVSGLRNTVALDFTYTSDNKAVLFYTDVMEDKIYSGTIEGNTLVNIRTVIDTGLSTTEGLAVDWVNENIYWVESNLDQIEVAKYDGSNRTTLVAGQMTSPRAIVVDPREGALFWTDWDGQNPRIEGCSMSGEGRRDIHRISPAEGGGWPNGLTIDFDFRRLYWIDARSKSVHTVDYQGKDHRLIAEKGDKISHPFALSLFGNYFYWTDWTTNSICRANKFNGSGEEVVQFTLTQPFDLQLIHPKRHPKRERPNPCEGNNGGCSHLCLISYNNQPGCRCPHRMRLAEDGKTCVEDVVFLLFVKNTEIRGVDLEQPFFNVIPVITIPHVDQPTSVDYDIQSDIVYWADQGLNVINRAKMTDGSSVETLIDSGLTNPQGFAIDWLSGNMYFSSYDDTSATISVSNLDGTYRTELIKHNITNPTSIALYPKKGLMFFTDKVNNVTASLYKANMAGGDVQVIHDGLSNPRSLAVDEDNDLVYLVNAGKRTIMAFDMNGKFMQLPIKYDNISEPTTLTVYKDTLYIADWGKDAIVSISVDGSGYRMLRNKTPRVQALRVYDRELRVAPGTKMPCEVNRGGCSQLCLPKGAMLSQCMCTAGYSLEPDNSSCKGITSFLLYSKTKEIRGQMFRIQDQTEALAPISKIQSASAVDFHFAEDYIYWVDSKANTISRIKHDQTHREVLVKNGVNKVEGLAVDWIAGNMYWTDAGHSTIEVAKLNGSNRYVVSNGDMEKPRSIVVHPEMGYIFWADCGTEPRIERARLDGSERVQYVYTDIQCPWGLSIDYDTHTLYWTDTEKKSIEAISLISHQRKVLSKDHKSSPLALTLFMDAIFWIEGNALWKFNQTTGKEESRNDFGKQIWDLKAFDERRQKGSNLCAVGNGGCAELCFYTGYNRTCACSFGRLAEDGINCIDYEGFILYSKVTSMESINLNDSNNRNPPHKGISHTENMQNVIGLAFDYSTKRIFFSDIHRGEIQSVFFNGTGHEVIVDGIGSAEGLAYDLDAKELFWTSYTNSCISKISLDPALGTKTGRKPVTVIQLSKRDHPRALAIDTCLDYIFWTNWNNDKPVVQRSDLDGKDARDLITTDILTPNGLTIDHKARKLYWSDARLDKIERCDFDGTNRIVIIVPIPQHSFGLAVYGEFLFWTDWRQYAVIRVNKYDGTGITFLRKNLKRQPMGIVAVAEDSGDCTLHPCHDNQFGCQDLCDTDERGVPHCLCKRGKLKADGKSCVPIVDCNNFHDYEAFTCNNNLCLRFEKSCDGVIDCLDGSDEVESTCRDRSCPATMFACRNRTVGQCIALSKQCDGISDCMDESDETECPCPPGRFRCKNGLCILKEYRCDGNQDCSDNSDEEKCDPKSCSPGLWACKASPSCIPLGKLCDGFNDCNDKSDESDTTCTNGTKHTCSEGMFRCDNGQCITDQWYCDRDMDCDDQSDEKNCAYSCTDEQFQCKQDKHCINKKWLCDDSSDCVDGSDEEGCNRTSCSADQFSCTSGRCISSVWLCDGEPDCPDGIDEFQYMNGTACPPKTCKKDEYECANGRCIESAFYCDHDDDCGDGSDENPEECNYENLCSGDQFQCGDGYCIGAQKKCDGIDDCPDRSDELHCGTTGGCNQTQYRCENQLCISMERVCDGRNDCGDNSDEPILCRINECRYLDPCGQLCEDLKVGFKCSCHTGYKLREDNVTCTNIDECQTQFPCSHFCHDTIGSYYCTCAENYTLGLDKRSCQLPEHEDAPYLVLSNRHYIHKIWFNGTDEMLKQGLTHTTAIDLDHKDKMLYWTDVTSHNSTISRIALPSQTPNNASTQVLHSSTVMNPDGIAVDWVGRNLYWCDRNTDTIEVSLLDGTFRKILVNDKTFLGEPRALEVFPAKGYLFISDWGDQPHISRITMDGVDRKYIVTEGVAWPNAITIDYVTEKLFWADANHDYIAMADLDGQNRHVIISDNLPHTYAMTTFLDYIFWTDWDTNSVFMAQKFTGEHRTKLASFIHRPMDLVVYHSLRQVPLKDNPCENHNCSHLCLLRPNENETGVMAVCACPENYELNPDNKTCVSNCTSFQFLCTGISKCIPLWWKCDGHNDCSDGSDEPSSCSTYHCSQQGLFQCKNATDFTGCIRPSQICDGEAQCADRSDETGFDNCENFFCAAHQFRCHRNNSYKCISDQKRCDMVQDCVGGEDEEDCVMPECDDNKFTCNQTKKCIPYMWMCDGDDDCGDGSDEPDNCRERVCKSSYIKCNVSGRCIPKHWQCDGDHDCGVHDTSDEDESICTVHNCSVSQFCWDNNRCIPNYTQYKVTCDPTYFKCQNNHCIPQRWRCDYDKDCNDGSDEANCDDTFRNCSVGEFRCDNNRCIPKVAQCNGKMDCADNSDEQNCSATVNCNSQQFRCAQGSSCIPKTWVCDGDRDCTDGSDETNCTEPCSSGEFACKTGPATCLPLLWRCDGEEDCDDKSDEAVGTCKMYACPPGRFRCGNHHCIPSHKRCNGIQDCPTDGSDENNCDDVVCDMTQFRCSDGSACTPFSKVCDGAPDCDDGSDEVSCEEKSSCGLLNGRCSHNCTQYDKYQQPSCSCPLGFKLAPNDRLCIEHNPCDDWGTCSQQCLEVSRGQPHCTCLAGFRKVHQDSSSPVTCLPDSKPDLLVAVENQVQDIQLHDLISLDHLLNIHINSSRWLSPNQKINAMAVDVTGKRDDWTMFLVNTQRGTITRQPVQTFRNSNRKRRALLDKTVVLQNLAEPQGIAVDYVGKFIYWTDSTSKRIEMSLYNGSQRITVVKDNLHHPFSIAVDPSSGKIFWTDHGYIPSLPKLETANLDGSGRKVLVFEQVIWPNGVALDHANRRVYWADTKSHTIETVTFEGNDRHIVRTFDVSDPPYMVDVFGDNLYVTTYKRHMVVSFPKFFNKSRDTVKSEANLEFPIGGLVIVHDHKQIVDTTNTTLVNSCEGAPCYPTQMCINMPGTEKLYSCVCPDGAVLEDKKCNFISCDASFCQNDGICMMQNGERKCSCSPQYRGSKCEVDRCATYCFNGGTCSLSETTKDLQCSCSKEYNGVRCELYKCSGLCKHNGICQINATGEPYCRCLGAYSGKTCDTKNENYCDNYCQNNGVCKLDAKGFRVCQCEPKFSGRKCEQCGKQDAAIHVCSNGGTCQYRNNGTEAYCNCQPGFSSRSNCETRTCDGYCLNNSTCSKVGEKLYCQCAVGFQGVRCDTVLTQCTPGYCQNNGTCLPGNSINSGGATCQCRDDFTGAFCETRLATNLCDGFCYHGKCTVEKDVQYCQCPINYQGRKCQECVCTFGQCNNLESNPTAKPCTCTNQLYEGDFCNRSICHDVCMNGGQCRNCTFDPNVNNGRCDSCVCKENTYGTRCEKIIPAKRRTDLIPIVVPILVVLLVILVIILVVVIRKRRSGQFRHRRMKDSPNMEVSNPIYMPQSTEEEEDDSRQPLDQPYDFDPEKSTNFANPIYEQYYTPHDSTRELLVKTEDDTDEEEEKNANEKKAPRL